MNDYDVEMPMTLYVGTYVRNVHARNAEEAIEKAVARIEDEGINMREVWINEDEIYDESAKARLVKENIHIQPKPSIEE